MPNLELRLFIEFFFYRIINVTKKMSKARKLRLKDAKSWYESQDFTEDSHIVKAYRKRFNVDKTCAMRELCLLHVLSPGKQAAYEKVLNVKKMKKIKKRQTEPEFVSVWESEFAFIAGYTPGGVPYGITRAEEELFENKYEDKI